MYAQARSVLIPNVLTLWITLYLYAWDWRQEELTRCQTCNISAELMHSQKIKLKDKCVVSNLALVHIREIDGLSSHVGGATHFLLRGFSFPLLCDYG
jgi:hypothetical protein